MSKPQPPTPPNPTTVANAQTGTNIGTAVANSTLGNVNQVNPFGTNKFTSTGGYTDPTTGQWVPSFTQTSKLNPTSEALLTGSQGLESTAQGLQAAAQGTQGGIQKTANSLLPTGQTLAAQFAGTAATPLNVNQTANNGIIAGGPQALDPAVAQAAYNASTNFLTPTFQQQQRDLQDQLARQGISVGNDAYGNAENQLQNTQNSALVGAANNATVTGAQQANNMFGLALQGQNQNLGQQQTVQQQPLSLLSALYGGSPLSPNVYGGINPASGMIA